MPLVNSLALLCSSSVAHLTIAYYLLTDPAAVAKHSFVAILGASMGLPPPSSLDALATPTTALAASIVSLLSISDLAATSLPEEVYSYYWSSQAPIRLLFFFALTAWAYIAKPGGLSFSGKSEPWVLNGAVGREVERSLGGFWGLSNGLVFTWGFVEMMWWFWIYVSLRDERREMAAKNAEKRRYER